MDPQSDRRCTESGCAEPSNLSPFLCAQDGVNPDLLEMMRSGSYFYKHDFGRNKRSRKHMKLSPDGLSLKWKAVGANETVAAESPGGSSARGGVFRSSSFSRTTSSAHRTRALLLNAACDGCQQSQKCCRTALTAAQDLTAALWSYKAIPTRIAAFCTARTLRTRGTSAVATPCPMPRAHGMRWH